jgi:hypothetical protein
MVVNGVLAECLGKAAFSHGGLNSVTVDIDDPVYDFNEHFTEVVRPEIPEHALRGERQIGLGGLVQPAENFRE